MATAESVRNKIINLTNKANEVTGNNDTNLTSAVNSLVDGYGGETVNLQEKSVTPSDQEQNVTADDGYTGLSSVTVEKIAKPFIDSSKMKYFAYMFSSTYGTDLSLLENLDASNGIDFSYMCRYRTDLTNLTLDVQNGENFSFMLDGCTGLISVTLNSHNGKNFNNMCRGCLALKNVDIDTSNGETFRFMFQGALVDTDPELDLGNATDLYSMYSGSKISGKLTLNAPKNKILASTFSGTTLLSEIDLGDTSSVENWNDAFERSGVETISCLDFSSATSVLGTFVNATNLKNVTFASIPIFDNNFSVRYSPLTAESLDSLVNALSDNSGLDTTYTVTLGADNIAKLTEEQLAIVAAKNINLA